MDTADAQLCGYQGKVALSLAFKAPNLAPAFSSTLQIVWCRKLSETSKPCVSAPYGANAQFWKKLSLLARTWEYTIFRISRRRCQARLKGQLSLVWLVWVNPTPLSVPGYEMVAYWVLRSNVEKTCCVVSMKRPYYKQVVLREATREWMDVVPDGLWPRIEAEIPKNHSSLMYLLGILLTF